MLSRPASFGRDSRSRAMLLLILLAGPASLQAQVIRANDVIEPRTFGYVIGDKIRREVHLSVHPDYRLDEESLPEAGRLDRWLEVAAPELDAATDGRGRHYRLILTYQIRNAPAVPEIVAIPQQNLRILSETQALTTLVPRLRITVAPLTSGIGADRISATSLQPDLPPVPLPLQERQGRIAWAAAALLALLLLAAWRHGLVALRSRQRLPFATAVRELKRLQAGASTPAQYPASLKIVHEAINRTAGRAVFAHNLDAFLASHSEFAPLREDFRRLFAASGQVFFASAPADEASAPADAPAGSAPAQLLRLCRRCRRIERRSFGRPPSRELHAAGN